MWKTSLPTSNRRWRSSDRRRRERECGEGASTPPSSSRELFETAAVRPPRRCCRVNGATSGGAKGHVENFMALGGAISIYPSVLGLAQHGVTILYRLLRTKLPLPSALLAVNQREGFPMATPVETALHLVPMVVEQTNRGERAYDIFSRLLKER